MKVKRKKRTKLVDLVVPKNRATHHAEVRHLKRSLPFYMNPRGVLIHRVEGVSQYTWRSGHKHIGVQYLCGNQTTTSGDGREFFVAKPPANRLVCQACELAAVRKRKPSADQLVGHHVHVGRIRVERVCCCDQCETN